jgi:hypothetical protein
MTRDVITKSDGTTVDIPKAEAESYDSNAKIMIRAGTSDSYIQRIAYVSGTSQPEYIGLAKPGTATSSAGWQIKKLTYSGTDVVSILFADGDTKFDNIWDNRSTSYIYS